jgi:hypothetical protein
MLAMIDEYAVEIDADAGESRHAPWGYEFTVAKAACRCPTCRSARLDVDNFADCPGPAR